MVQMLAMAATPLVQIDLHNSGSSARRVRVTTCVEAYSTQVVSTEVIQGGQSVSLEQFPPFLAERQRSVDELTIASLHVRVDDWTPAKPSFTSLNQSGSWLARLPFCTSSIQQRPNTVTCAASSRPG